MSSIYNHPETYDLEHSGSEPDVGFFVSLAQRFQPSRLLDLACGNGRTTRPLAQAAQAWGGSVHGVDVSEQMLDDARQKSSGPNITYEKADARQLEYVQTFDLVVSACASLSHLLKLEDQLAAWRRVYKALKPGGRFIVAEVAPDYPSMAASMQTPHHAHVRLDGDFKNEEARLIRYRTERYHAHDQRLTIHFLYDHFTGPDTARRFVNDYEAHVYFPNELRLLFISAGFVIEQEWGAYDGSPLAHDSHCLIISGRRPES